MPSYREFADRAKELRMGIQSFMKELLKEGILPPYRDLVGTEESLKRAQRYLEQRDDEERKKVSR